MKSSVFCVLALSLTSLAHQARADFTVEPAKISVDCEGRSNDEIMIRHSGTGRVIYKTTRYHGIQACRNEAKNLKVMLNAASFAGMKIKINSGNQPSNDIKIDMTGDKLLVSPLGLQSYCGGDSGDNLMVANAHGSIIYRTSRYWSGMSGCRSDAAKVQSEFNAAAAVGKQVAFSLNNDPDSDFGVSDSDDPLNPMNRAKAPQRDSSSQGQATTHIDSAQ